MNKTVQNLGTRSSFYDHQVKKTEDIYTQRVKQPIYCANCGCIGHIYKNCNHPITSYGIICYRFKVDTETNTLYPEYLLVQRKDSLCFVEFMRGKYLMENRSYLLKLFTNMTISERENIRHQSFDELWKQLWQVKECTNYLKEYQEAKQKFDTLKKGYFLQNDSNTLEFLNIDNILDNTSSTYDETEWGFPKGRRNINELDLACAIREFNEETGIPLKQIKISKDCKPVEEIFSGSNKIRYRHMYYIASYVFDRCTKRTTLNRTQLREIKSVSWFTYHDAQKKIRDTNVERKELFKRVNQMILKNQIIKNMCTNIK